jgi:hypothetical protein
VSILAAGRDRRRLGSRSLRLVYESFTRRGARGWSSCGFPSRSLAGFERRSLILPERAAGGSPGLPQGRPGGSSAPGGAPRGRGRPGSCPRLALSARRGAGTGPQGLTRGRRGVRKGPLDGTSKRLGMGREPLDAARECVGARGGSLVVTRGPLGPSRRRRNAAKSRLCATRRRRRPARGPLGKGRGRLGLGGEPLGVPTAPLGAGSELLPVRRGPLEIFRRVSRYSWMSSASSSRTCRESQRHSPCAERISRCSASACPPMEGTSPHGDRTSRYSGEDVSQDRERLYEDGEDVSERREDRSPVGRRAVAIPSGPPRMRRGPLGRARDSLPAPRGTPRRPSGHLAVPRRLLRICRAHANTVRPADAELRFRLRHRTSDFGPRSSDLGTPSPCSVASSRGHTCLRMHPLRLRSFRWNVPAPHRRAPNR